VKSEESIDIEVPDEDIIIKVRIDTLVLRDQLWVMIIESKKVSFSALHNWGMILSQRIKHNPRVAVRGCASGASVSIIPIFTKRLILN